MSRRALVVLVAIGCVAIGSASAAAVLDHPAWSLVAGLCAAATVVVAVLAVRSASDRAVLRDPSTGLVRQHGLELILQQRVGAARRTLRPLALAQLEIGSGLHQDEAIAARVADLARVRLRESDIVFRLGARRYAVLLEDTSEDGAVWAVERLRRALSDVGVDTPLWAGVACYPAHSMDALGVRRSSSRALQMAREWPQARIEVAPLSD